MSAVLEPVHRLSVDDVAKMMEAGVLSGEVGGQHSARRLPLS
jgi:hypothetical protein